MDTPWTIIAILSFLLLIILSLLYFNYIIIQKHKALLKKSLDADKVLLESEQRIRLLVDASIEGGFATGMTKVDDPATQHESEVFADTISNKKLVEENANTLEQMHQLLRFTDKAIENERLAISRELHDDLGQALTAVKIDLEIIKRNVPESREMDRINKTSALVSDTIKTVQKITARLRPDIIDDLGLEAAIEWYVKEFSERYSLPVLLKIEPEIEVSVDSSLAIFRIMQESLTNIARHSKATSVDVKLLKITKDIHFIINDNGIGIDKDAMKSKMAYGIMGMSERALSMGGTFNIHATEPKGTQMKVVIPCQ